MSSNGTALLNEFVALDVETTGLRPLTHRIIEIALIHYRDGLEIRQMESLLNPEREIPKYIVHLTRIDNEMVDTRRFSRMSPERRRNFSTAP